MRKLTFATCEIAFLLSSVPPFPLLAQYLRRRPRTLRQPRCPNQCPQDVAFPHSGCVTSHRDDACCYITERLAHSSPLSPRFWRGPLRSRLCPEPIPFAVLKDVLAHVSVRLVPTSSASLVNHSGFKRSWKPPWAFRCAHDGEVKRVLTGCLH